MVTDTMTGYLDGLAARLAADGCEVRTEDWSGTRVLVGYRSDFRLRWIATKLHLFTIALPMPEVTVSAIETFANSAMDYALARKGQLRGLQSAVAVLPALVSTRVDPAAMQWASSKQRMRFACMARPVVVDVSSNTAGAFSGTAMLGWVYSGHLRRKLRLYFPSPTVGRG